MSMALPAPETDMPVGATDEAEPGLVMEIESAIERVEKELHREVWQRRLPNAKRAMQPVWDDYNAAHDAYFRRQVPPNARQAASDRDFVAEVAEVADQVDEMVSLITDLCVQSGDMYKFAPAAGEVERRVKLAEELLKSDDRACNAKAEMQRFAFHVVNYRFGCLKACREYGKRQVRTWKDVPPDVAASWQQQRGNAIIPSMEEFVESQLSGQPPPTAKICEIEEIFEDRFPLRCVRPDRIAFEDPARLTVDEVPSVHEFSYYTRPELDRAGSYRNMEKIGMPNAAGRVNPTGTQSDPTEQRNRPDPGNYELVESWLVYDWAAIFKNAQVQNPLPVVLGLAEKYELNPAEIMEPGDGGDPIFRHQLWCVQTTEREGCVHKLYSDYLADVLSYPYVAVSYVPGEGLIGLSLQNRLSDLNAALNMAVNMWMKNVRKQTYGSKAIAGNLDVSDEELAKLDTDEGVARIPANMSLAEALQWYTPNDISGSAQGIIGFLETKIRNYGVPAILQGEGNAGTATQDAINNKRGQTKVNSLAQRIVEQALLPITLKRFGAMATQMDRGRWIDILGEEGTLIERRFTSPADITNQIHVAGIGSFDAIERRMLAQDLTNVMNIVSRAPMAPVITELLALQMEMRGHDREAIDRVRNAAGAATTLIDEMRALERGPEIEVPVRDADNHQAALIMLQMLLQQRPELSAWPNVVAYRAQHMAFMQAQMAQAMAASPPPGGRPGANGPPRTGPQPPPPPAIGERGMTASDAGKSSPPDSGGMTQAGITGQASPPRMLAMAQ